MLISGSVLHKNVSCFFLGIVFSSCFVLAMNPCSPSHPKTFFNSLCFYHNLPMGGDAPFCQTKLGFDTFSYFFCSSLVQDASRV